MLFSFVKQLYDYKTIDFDTSDTVNIRVGNFIAFLSFSLSGSYSFIYIFLGSLAAFVLSIFFSCLYFMYFYFLSRDNLFLSKLSIFIIFVFQISTLTILFSSSKSGLHFFLILVIPVCFLLFNKKSNIVFRIVVSLISIVCLTITELFTESLFPFDINDTTYRVLHSFNLVTVFVILFIIMYIFNRELSKNYTILHRLSQIDTLTGILNRRAFYSNANYLIRHSRRYNNGLGLLLFDIDNFKKVNDLYGHDAGDIVLKDLSSLISSSVRDVDCFCRYGGEEFILLVPSIIEKELITLSEKLRVLVEEQNINLSKEKKIKITVSIGATMFKDKETLKEFIKRADTAMYDAKNSGKNKFVYI